MAISLNFISNCLAAVCNCKPQEKNVLVLNSKSKECRKMKCSLGYCSQIFKETRRIQDVVQFTGEK